MLLLGRKRRTRVLRAGIGKRFGRQAFGEVGRRILGDCGTGDGRDPRRDAGHDFASRRAGKRLGHDGPPYDQQN